MPSQRHETLIELFRNRPRLAAELLDLALEVKLPEFTEARVSSTDFTQIQPAEYRADLVVLLQRDVPVFGIVVEVQLGIDPRKLLTWPVYATDLRARLRCETGVLVVCPDDSIARWAAQPISLGAGNTFKVVALGPAGVPVIVDPDVAKNAPELAVLSAISHGQKLEPSKAAELAAVALTAAGFLDDPVALLYADMVIAALSDAARKAFQAMDPAKYQFQSDFAKRFLAEGKAEGRAEGKAETVLKLLTLRFGPLDDGVLQKIRAASLGELDTLTERILTAQTLTDVLQ